MRGKGILHVLRVLSRSPGEPFSAPDLAHSGRLALSHVQRALAILEAEGIVDRRVMGRTHLWSLEPNNAMLAPLRALFEAEERLEGDLMRDLRQGLRCSGVRRAVLFGSVARGDEKGWSDVDILVELRRASDRDAVEDQLFSVRRKVRDRYGLVLSPILVTREDLRERISPSFLATVQREGLDLLRDP